MNLQFDENLATGYKKATQRIRVMSETWAVNNLFCPCCGKERIIKLPNNAPVADLICENCNEIFELKSKKNKFGKKISDGAYATAVERIKSSTNPDLLALLYNERLQVTDLQILPKYFFVPSILEKRKPLSNTARRAGWVGCNILYSEIPVQGKVTIIQNGTWIDREAVCEAYSNSKAIQINSIEMRGWLIDVLNCVNSIKYTEFTLQDVYKRVNSLKEKHPTNNNIEAKIRQQLQLLRNKGFLLFLGNGRYRKI